MAGKGNKRGLTIAAARRIVHSLSALTAQVDPPLTRQRRPGTSIEAAENCPRARTITRDSTIAPTISRVGALRMRLRRTRQSKCRAKTAGRRACSLLGSVRFLSGPVGPMRPLIALCSSSAAAVATTPRLFVAAVATAVATAASCDGELLVSCCWPQLVGSAGNGAGGSSFWERQTRVRTARARGFPRRG